MKKYTEYKNRTKKPLAVFPLYNFGGIAIFDIIQGFDHDFIISGFDNGEEITDIKKTKVFLDPNGNGYFIRYSKKYNISDFMIV